MMTPHIKIKKININRPRYSQAYFGQNGVALPPNVKAWDWGRGKWFSTMPAAALAFESWTCARLQSSCFGLRACNYCTPTPPPPPPPLQPRLVKTRLAWGRHVVEHMPRRRPRGCVRERALLALGSSPICIWEPCMHKRSISSPSQDICLQAASFRLSRLTCIVICCPAWASTKIGGAGFLQAAW